MFLRLKMGLIEVCESWPEHDGRKKRGRGEETFFWENGDRKRKNCFESAFAFSLFLQENLMELFLLEVGEREREMIGEGEWEGFGR